MNYDALTEIADDATLTGPSGTSTRVDAEALANGISKFSLVVSLILWYNILFEINITSKQMQSKDLAIDSALEQLEHTKKYLNDCRSDKAFDEMLVDAGELADGLGISKEFEKNPVRNRRRKQQFTYEGKVNS